MLPPLPHNAHARKLQTPRDRKLQGATDEISPGMTAGRRARRLSVFTRSLGSSRIYAGNGQPITRQIQ